MHPQFILTAITSDPQVVRAACEGKRGKDLKILAVTVLTSLDRADLDANLIKPGDSHEITLERAAKALEAGADGVIASPQEAAMIRALPILPVIGGSTRFQPVFAGDVGHAVAQAIAQAQAFEAQAAQTDENSCPEELKADMNQHKMKPMFEALAQGILLPQFFLKLPYEE